MQGKIFWKKFSPAPLSKTFAQKEKTKLLVNPNQIKSLYVILSEGKRER